MTLDELNEWMASNKLVASGGEWDGRGNHITFSIYREIDSDKYYRIEFCNGHPSEKYIPMRGYIRGVYELDEVVKKTKTIELEVWIKN